MRRLFRAILIVGAISALISGCKKDLTEKKKPENPTPQPQPKKDTTFVLGVTVAGEANYDGTGKVAYTVKSVMKVGDNDAFRSWKMEFSTDGGESWSEKKPDYLALTTEDSAGDVQAKTYNATFTAQVAKTIEEPSDNLRSKAEVSNVDLSLVDVLGNEHGKGQTTANCYVIHNPGTYRFPVIYGNAMKGGVENATAYNSYKFKDYKEKRIAKAQIDGVKDACLVWQDVKDLVSEIKYEAGYVSFRVKKESICSGNAVIAVRDNDGVIMWSWHIWATDKNLTSVEVTNNKNVSYKFLPFNLGWCEYSVKETYEARSVSARIKQEGGKISETIVFKQKAHSGSGASTSGNNVYYQWGRKDPMLAGSGDGIDKSCFADNETYKFSIKGLKALFNIGPGIQNPNKFNLAYQMDYDIDNMWDNGNTANVVKTIYDPSPSGFCVPDPDAFNGFTTTGETNGYGHEDAGNVSGVFKKGWYFYTKPNKTGDLFFFPANGNRSHTDGMIYDVESNYAGYYWSSGAGSAGNARRFSFTSKFITPSSSYYRGEGYSVRPVEEK